MGWDEDRARARRDLRKLREALDRAEGSDVSPDAKLAAQAAVVNAEALLLCSDTLHGAMDELQRSVIPRLKRTLGPRGPV